MLMLHDFPIVLDVIVDIVFIVEGYFHECFLLLRQAFVLFDLQITIVLVPSGELVGSHRTIRSNRPVNVWQATSRIASKHSVSVLR